MHISGHRQSVPHPPLAGHALHSAPSPAVAQPEMTAALQAGDVLNQAGGPPPQDELKQAFTDFVGQTMFGQMIKSMRTGQQPASYFHGGRAEEIFQGQLDQVLAEQMSQASAKSLADPMFELFMLKRQS